MTTIDHGLCRLCRGQRPHSVRQDEGPLLCQRGARRAPPRARGHGLGDGGVLDAPPGQPGALPPGREQAEAQPPQRGDPAAHRKEPPGGGGPRGPGGEDHHRGLRRPARRRRHPHRLRHRRLRGACHRLPEAGGDGRTGKKPHQGAGGVSAGIVEDVPLLDLCYEEDSRAMVDLNCVMNERGELIELQGTGEGRGFTVAEQRALVDLCAGGIRELMEKQKEILGGRF